VWNKADKLADADRAAVVRALASANERRPVLVSARSGEGIEALRQAIDASLGSDDEILTLEIPARAGRLLSWLHDNAEVLGQETADSGAVTARVRIGPAARAKFQGQLRRAGLA
jgi:GTP-binding protein HflX